MLNENIYTDFQKKLTRFQSVLSEIKELTNATAPRGCMLIKDDSDLSPRRDIEKCIAAKGLYNGLNEIKLPCGTCSNTVCLQ